MKKGELSSDTFSYKGPHRLNDRNYILAVRDKDSNTNVLSILYYQDGRIQDIDEYEMGDKIWTTPNNLFPDAQNLSSKFSANQLIKISSGFIVENLGHYCIL